MAAVGRPGLASFGQPVYSDSEEDEYKRAGRRLASSLDLSKLELGSLQRYRKAYKLPDFPAASREDLLAATLAHFAAVCVDEDETLIKFAMACRRNGQRSGLALGPGIGKRPRAGSVKPRGGRG